MNSEKEQRLGEQKTIQDELERRRIVGKSHIQIRIKLILYSIKRNFLKMALAAVAGVTIVGLALAVVTGFALIGAVLAVVAGVIIIGLALVAVAGMIYGIIKSLLELRGAERKR